MVPANIPLSKFSHKIVTASVMMATIMQALDTTIANVALPHMQGSLSATQDQMTWVLTCYIVSSAIATPLSGWLAGQIGRRKVLMLSVIGFTIASVLCGMAQSINEIVLFRLFQGVCGAALSPLSQSILFDINSPANFGKAMAGWGMAITLGPILGPALGGWLTDNYNWRWVFYINVPIGIAAFVGLLSAMPETKNAQRSKLDLFGFFTLSLAVSALQLMLDRGSTKDWFNSTEIIVECILAVLGFYWFIVHSLTANKPFISLALFKDRNFVLSNILIFIVGMVMFASLALIPQLLQSLLGYPVVLTGLITAPRGVGVMMAMLLGGKVIDKVDPRKIIACGLLCTAASLWQMMGFSLFTGSMDFITSGFVQGLGIGLVFVALSITAFSTLPGHLRNEGTSLFSLLRNIGSAVGISIVTFLLVRNTQIMHSSLVQHITPYSANNFTMAQVPLDLQSTHGLAMIDGMITKQAAMVAYLDDFKLMLLMTSIAIPFLLLMTNPRKATKS
jgi:DHA2 family multidrug resistance protein